MNFQRIVLSLALLSFLSPWAFSDDHPFKIDSDLDTAINAGLQELYNFNFDKSLAIFDSVKDREAEHPMVAFGVASTEWWRISSYVLEADPAESKLFIEAANNCVKLSEALIKKGDPTGEGHLVLGGALGLLGRWQATNHQWMSAYFNGKKAYKYLTKALKINPQLKDAYMGLGIFDYYIATLPAVVRVLAFLGTGGDPQVGLKELHDAAANGIYARTPSKLFLMQIYTEMEGTPEKAVEILAELKKEYPRSPFMQMMNVIALYDAGRVGQLFEEAVDFEKKINDRTYDNDFYCQSQFAMGLTHFKVEKWTEATVYFGKARETTDPKDPWRTWAGLYLGFCHDAMGQREEAIKQYKWVLTQLRRWGSHDLAKARLSKPFKGTEQDLKKLML